jgi:hypothetical protein
VALVNDGGEGLQRLQGPGATSPWMTELEPDEVEGNSHRLVGASNDHLDDDGEFGCDSR